MAEKDRVDRTGKAFLKCFKMLSDVRFLLDTVCTAASFLASYLLIFHPELGSVGAGILPSLGGALIVGLVAQLGVFFFLGVYRCVWRYASAYDAYLLGKALSLTAILAFGANRIFFPELAKIPFALVNLLLTTALLGGARLCRRFRHESLLEAKIHQNGRRTLIYGAGISGKNLASWAQTDAKLGIWPIGYIDDHPANVGTVINGLRVFGSRREMPDFLRALKIQDLIVTDESLTGSALEDVLQVAHSFHVRPRVMKDGGFGPNHTNKHDALRDIELEDLLKRAKISADLSATARLVRGKSVLVTGGGGSIGTEIVHQISRLNPARLLILDNSEYNLYKVMEELKGATPDCAEFIPLLVDLKEKTLLESTFARFRPDVVYHAAAYKHVHLVESNPCPAILNNVLGMKHLLGACEAAGTEVLVLISSDKAVNPGGIMGATKRVCELLLKSAAQRTGRRYCAVRFGNVLGSSGSLIPLFKKQIRNGGPVTVTHPDMTRYFMLIPEAVSLVLLASGISKPGDINILRMGEPIRILDIARSMITLLGRTPSQVPIVFTGMRPGEKLFEELYFSGDEIATESPEILVLPDREQQYAHLGEALPRIIELARLGDDRAVVELMALVEHYNHLSDAKSSGQIMKKAA